VVTVKSPRPVRRLVVSSRIRAALERHVAETHPAEARGYLRCEREGARLVATEAVPVANDAAEPKRRFETTVDERAPGLPRAFYLADIDLLVQVELTGRYDHEPVVTAENTLTLLKKRTGIG
jgi:proteasome lid subunit RPN8/RPN11